MSWAPTIRTWRKDAGYTLAEAGFVLGVSFQTVYRWEHGKFEPKSKAVREYVLSIIKAGNKPAIEAAPGG